MFPVSSKHFNLLLLGTRRFSICERYCQKSHYDTLGITPKATVADVKTAYYRLSKLYHPDTNPNDATAVEKFREVSDAYEVLGNITSRRLYDRGAHHHGVGIVKTSEPGFTVPEDTQAAFYRSRLQKRMEYDPRNSTYNFDEWTRSHYSENIQDASNAKTGYRRVKIKKFHSEEQPQSSNNTNRFLGVFLVLMAIGFSALTTSPDVPKDKG